MSRFTVRVEMHGASEQDYLRLHEAMGKSGFSRVIQAGDRWYHLPTAEYDHTSHESTLQVCDRAYAIASSVRNNPAVLVTQGDAALRGLTPV